MSKVQEYLKKKKIQEMGLPKLYVVKSSPDGVEKPVERQVVEIIVKWLANKLGYKVVMLKASKGTTTIEGDKELLRYVDISGYFFKKEPLRRTPNN